MSIFGFTYFDGNKNESARSLIKKCHTTKVAAIQTKQGVAGLKLVRVGGLCMCSREFIRLVLEKPAVGMQSFT